MVMDLQQKIADLAVDGIETDSNNIFLNIGKSYSSRLKLPVGWKAYKYIRRRKPGIFMVRR